MLSDEVARPRLTAVLAARWHASAVLVEAPAGYGKSIALAQAMRANADAPVGTDAYVACRRFHATAQALAAAVLSALGAPTRVAPEMPDAAADAVCAVAAAHAPGDVCIILDDVHHLRADDSASAMLRALVPQMPANLHLVLAGRTLPSLPLTRLRAADALIEVGAADLAFTADEIMRLAAAHGADASHLRGADGWPALTRLAITAGAVAPLHFLLEEVAGALAPHTARVVAAVAIGRHLSAAEVESVTGVDDARRAVAAVPLVSVGAAPEAVLTAHDLWTDALELLVDDDTRCSLAARIAALAAAHDRCDEAIDIATAHGAWQQALDGVLGFVGGGESFPSAARAAELRARFPAAMDGEPELALLDAMVGRIGGAPGGGADAADRALAAFVARGGIGPIVAAAFEVGYGAWLRGDLRRVLEVYELAQRIDAASHPVLAPMASIVEAVAADLRGDARAAADHLLAVDCDAIPSPLVVYVLRELMSKLQIVGDTAGAVAQGERLQRYSSDERIEFSLALAHWLDGDPGPALAGWAHLRHRRIGHDQTDFLTAVYSTVIDASLGIDVDPDAVPPASTGRSRERAFRAIATAAALVQRGDEVAAAHTIESLLDDLGDADPLVAGELRRQPSLPVLLSARARMLVDDGARSDAQRRRIDLARLLLAARGEAAPDWSPLTVPPPAEAAARVLTALPLVWTAELLAHALVAGVPSAADVAERVDTHTDGRLQVLLEARAAADAGASALHRQLSRGRRGARLAAFGPLRIEHDDPPGAVAVSRARLRQLLGVLVLRESVRVDEVLAALWPTLAPARARNNLAVHLTMLRALLEGESGRAAVGPGDTDEGRVATGERGADARVDARDSIDEAAGAATGEAGGMSGARSVVQRDATHVRLRSRTLHCDLWDLRRDLDSVALRRRGGDHGGAMRLAASALTRWSGPLLPDLDFLDPFAAETAALTRSLVTLACDVAEWRVARGELAQAAASARQALAADPYEERAHAALVRALASTADPTELDAAVAACRHALAELDVVPGEQLAMVLRAAGAPRRSTATLPGAAR